LEEGAIGWSLDKNAQCIYAYSVEATLSLASGELAMLLPRAAARPGLICLEDAMAEIRRYPFVRHLRVEASSHVLHYKGSRLKHSGRGLSLWFWPLSESLAEVPADDREISLLVHGRSSDFQDVTIQGVMSYRVADPVRIADRIDFTLDPGTGAFLRQPLEKIAQLLSQLVQQHATDYISLTPIRRILAEGQVQVRILVEHALKEDAELKDMGLVVVSVRIVSVKPNADLEKAMEAPMRELIKQEADEAAFQRRAQAVEKERAIQENELQNRIELAKREELLIGQQGANTKRQVLEKAEADAITLRSQMQALQVKTQAETESQKLKAEGAAQTRRLQAQTEADATRLSTAAEAEGIRAVEGSRSEAERQRLEAYAQLPAPIMLGLALKELAGKLERIDHLNLGSEILGPALVNLLEAGTRSLSAPKEV